MCVVRTDLLDVARLIRQPTCVRSIEKGRAVLRSVTRTTRRWGNPRFAQSIRDAARAGRRESRAEVERKSESRQSRSKTCSFSYLMISAISRSRPLRVRRILRYHLRGGAGSLFRGTKMTNSTRRRLERIGSDCDCDLANANRRRR